MDPTLEHKLTLECERVISLLESLDEALSDMEAALVLRNVHEKPHEWSFLRRNSSDGKRPSFAVHV